MRRERFQARFLMVLALAAATASCGGNGDGRSADVASGTVFRMAIDEPNSIDPYRASEFNGLFVAQNLFVGLVRVDPETSEVRSGVAETWVSNPECTAWTFHLRAGETFSDGTELGAQSFIDGMTRASKADAASPVAYYMSGIAGYQALHDDGQSPGTARDFAGLSTPDPQTLSVQLSTPDCEFHKKAAHPVMSPVPPSAGPAKNRAYNDMPLGNGPFKMKEPWRHDNAITLVRNERYSGTAPAVDEVRLRIIADLNTAYRSYAAGDLDFAFVPRPKAAEAMEKYEGQGLLLGPAITVDFFAVSNFNPPLNSPDARRAVSHAIDRQTIADVLLKGSATPATTLVPPAFPAYYQEGVCDACTHDVEKAKRAAGRAGLIPGTKLTFTYVVGGSAETYAPAIAQQIESALDLDVNLEPKRGNDLLDHESSDAFAGISVSGWFADYPSAENYLSPLLSSAALAPHGNNVGRYSNAEFDALLTKAREAGLEADRITPIQAAERIGIGRDLGLIPLFYERNVAVFNSDAWSGVNLNFFQVPTLETVRPK